ELGVVGGASGERGLGGDGVMERRRAVIVSAGSRRSGHKVGRNSAAQRSGERVKKRKAYAGSEIQWLSAAPMMPASAIIISTAGNPPSAKADAPPATPQLPPRKVQALMIPEPCPACAGASAESASRGAKA